MSQYERALKAELLGFIGSPDWASCGYCTALQGRGIGRFMVARTVEFLKEEEIGNICLFADADGDSTLSAHVSIQDAM